MSQTCYNCGKQLDAQVNDYEFCGEACETEYFGDDDYDDEDDDFLDDDFEDDYLDEDDLDDDEDDLEDDYEE